MNVLNTSNSDSQPKDDLYEVRQAIRRIQRAGRIIPDPPMKIRYVYTCPRCKCHVVSYLPGGSFWSPTYIKLCSYCHYVYYVSD